MKLVSDELASFEEPQLLSKEHVFAQVRVLEGEAVGICRDSSQMSMLKGFEIEFASG